MADIDALTTRATTLVRAATRTWIYATHPDGTPADPDVAATLDAAIQAQVEFWTVAGLDPIAVEAGMDHQVAAKSLDGASVTYTGLDRAAAARLTAATSLCREARDILDDADTPRGIQVVG